MILPASFEACSSGMEPEKRQALGRLRDIILETAPGAGELISYGLWAFRFRGRMLVGIGAATGHCALYLMSTGVMEAFRDRLAGFDRGRGTLRFQPCCPPSPELVRDLVQARIRENSASRPAGAGDRFGGSP